MKLRVADNRIRLRLGQAEVRAAAAGKTVEVRCALVPVPLVARLVPLRDQPAASIAFADGVLTITLCASDVAEWANGDAVGIERDARSGAAEIRLLIEKDFRCLHGDGDGSDQGDCYPNPNEAATVTQ